MNTRCDRVCRCDEITNLTMGDIEDLGSAILVKIQDTKHKYNPPPPGGTAILPEYIHYYGYYYQVIVQCLST
jgi:hypothetical protein